MKNVWYEIMAKFMEVRAFMNFWMLTPDISTAAEIVMLPAATLPTKGRLLHDVLFRQALDMHVCFTSIIIPPCGQLTFLSQGAAHEEQYLKS